MTSFRFLFLCFFLSFSASAEQAGPPKISLVELASISSVIISGWPTSQGPYRNCEQKKIQWFVQRVYKGDKDLEGKVIALSGKYKEQLRTEQRASILFLDPNPDSCFELKTPGAQVEQARETLIEAILKGPHDCDLQSKAFLQVLATLPKNCQKNSDCAVFFLHPNSCEDPLILNSAFGSKVESQPGLDWNAHVSRIRGACQDNWGKLPPCGPRKAPRVQCKDSICLVSSEVR